jgi:hypothetical protein
MWDPLFGDDTLNTVHHYQIFTPAHIYTLRNRVTFLLVNSYMTWDITCASPILSVSSVCLQLYLSNFEL